MSAYLLDTLVLSELIKPVPQPSVVAWIDAGDELAFYLSALTIGEIQKGVSRLPPSARRSTLQRWLREDLASRFDGRILPVDAEVATVWGELAGEAERRGTSLPVIDGLIAATARVHGLTVVTRNVRDLQRFGVPVLNPWETQGT